MVAQTGNKPVFKDKEGNVQFAVFRNTNINRNSYPLICITVCRFPLSYARKIYLNPSELNKLRVLLERVPKDIKIKEGKK
jgi:hypothetical protein